MKHMPMGGHTRFFVFMLQRGMPCTYTRGCSTRYPCTCTHLANPNYSGCTFHQ